MTYLQDYRYRKSYFLRNLFIGLTIYDPIKKVVKEEFGGVLDTQGYPDLWHLCGHEMIRGFWKIQLEELTRDRT